MTRDENKQLLQEKNKNGAWKLKPKKFIQQALSVKTFFCSCFNEQEGVKAFVVFFLSIS